MSTLKAVSNYIELTKIMPAFTVDSKISVMITKSYLQTEEAKVWMPSQGQLLEFVAQL